MDKRTDTLFPQRTRNAKAIIGMLHLLPLPGSPRYGGNVAAVRTRMLRDAQALANGGVDALLIENFGDAPFAPGTVGPHVVAQMATLAAEVARTFDLPLGINVLRNDGRSALAIAQAVGAAFIRVNVLCGARLTDQGIIQGIAHDLLRDRAMLGAGHIRVFADLDVKHSSPLGQPQPLTLEFQDTVSRGLADGVILSGSGTGVPADLEHLIEVRQAAGGRHPVLVGSGIDARTIRAYAPHADGFIVGSTFKRKGQVQNPVDQVRVRAVVDALNRAASR